MPQICWNQVGALNVAVVLIFCVYLRHTRGCSATERGDEIHLPIEKSGGRIPTVNVEAGSFETANLTHYFR